MPQASIPKAPVLCVGCSPALQRNLVFPDWDGSSDVVRCQEPQLSVGGKATNAARALQRLGTEVSLLSVAGGAQGEKIQGLLHAEGIQGLWVESAAETRCCQTLLREDGSRIRELVEEAASLTLREWAELFSRFEQALAFHSSVLICGSLPKEAPLDVYASLCRMAREAGKELLIDATGPGLEQALPEQARLVKINREELRASSQAASDEAAIQDLLKRGAQALLITDGPRPAFLAMGKKRWRYQLPEIKVLNPIGGGDTVAGAMAHFGLAAKQLPESTRMALACSMAQSQTANPAEFDPELAKELASQIKMKKL